MIPENSPCRLLVEGSDDRHCILHLMKRHNVDWSSAAPMLPYVHDCGGFSPLLASLRVSAKTYCRLGIMVDANADMRGRWIQVKDGLGRAGVTLPESPRADGVVVPGMYPDWRVGVWLMPDNERPGQLEDFLGKLVPPNDTCWAYAAEAARRARGLGARFVDKDFPKAGVHTWLAWQETPGLPFGTAITAKYFGVDSPEALRFVAWFNQLFS
jgi:hypothetical protein